MSAQRGPVVHLMCGLPGSGKTTLARQLAVTHRAIRFTLDEWMLTLYDYTIDMPEYGQYVTRCQEVIWQTGLQILTAGRDIILDWSLWSKARRRTWSQRIAAAGFAYYLYYLNIPIAVLEARLAQRNAQRPEGTHRIDVAALRRFVPLFEVPTADEGLPIIEVREGDGVTC